MKNGLLILVLFVTVGIMAQNPRNEKREERKEKRMEMQDFTPEQIADLRTKKLTLHLDLNAEQQKEVKKLELVRAIKRDKYKSENRKFKELNSKERFERKSKMLDEKIEAKRKMKSILTEVQFQKWESGLHKKHDKKRQRPNNNR